jgi:phenylacetate-CoA ligase
MPMIRYDIGDSGRLKEGECGCGWAFPLMEMGMCRQNDLIRTRSGRSIHPSYFNGLLYGVAGIRQYQWRQTAPDRLVLTLVAASPLEAEFAARLGERIRRDVDAGMAFELVYADAIPRTASGKHRFVLSEPGP